MNIDAFRTLLENMASRPLDNPQGDLAPEAAPDMSGGAGGIGADPHALRTADNLAAVDPLQPGIIPDVPGGIGQDPKRPLDKTVAEEEEDGEKDEDDGTMAESFTKHMQEHVKFEISFKDSGLLESLELDEDLAAKAADTFQKVIQEAADAHATKLNTIAGQVMEQVIKAKVEVMEAAVDKYMDTVVTEWMEENKIAVAAGIRTEIAESFMEEMKTVFERHYVEMPKSKKDLYEEAISKGEEIFVKLTESEVAKAELAGKLQAAEKRLVVESVVAGMVATKAHKVRELAESMEFDAGMESKLRAIAEELNEEATKTAEKPISSPITEDVSSIVADLQEDARLQKAIDPQVASYMSFFNRL